VKRQWRTSLPSQNIALGSNPPQSPRVGLDTAPNFSLRYWLQGFLGTRRGKANHIGLVLPLADAMIEADLDFGAISEARWLVGYVYRNFITWRRYRYRPCGLALLLRSVGGALHDD
jgi:hypothetical protein